MLEMCSISLTRHRLEQPKRNIGLIVRSEVNFSRQTSQIIQRLCRNMIEIDQMSNCVDQREKQCGASDDFMELNMRIQWNILLNREFLQFRQKIP